jgi:hypothetical protein
MSEHCGTTTEEGNAVCIPGSCSCSTESKKSETSLSTLFPPDSNGALLVAKLKKIFPFNKTEGTHVEENS